MKDEYYLDTDSGPIICVPMIKLDIAIDALEKIIEMNRETANHKYGNRTKADEWGCNKVAIDALKRLSIYTNTEV